MSVTVIPAKERLKEDLAMLALDYDFNSIDGSNLLFDIRFESQEDISIVLKGYDGLDV